MLHATHIQRPSLGDDTMSIEALSRSYFDRPGRPPRTLASRVRIRMEGSARRSWLVELHASGPSRIASDGNECPADVEIIAAEPVLRAIAHGRSPVAMLLLGRMRVRGDLAHIDELARTLVHGHGDTADG